MNCCGFKEDLTLYTTLPISDVIMQVLTKYPGVTPCCSSVVVTPGIILYFEICLM